MKQTLTLFLLLFNLNLFAQKLEGSITNTYRNPIEGGFVLNKRIDKHSHSNKLGYFVLDKVNKGDTLEISCMGFKTQKIVYRPEQKFLQIVLEESVFQLNEVTISPEVNAQSIISKIDLKTYPVNSSQEILRKVPGLFIGQHAGGGKAEQLFLRGFDLDHGTDINISVDGMPVNMVSHAHGQGYADLHFLIPETIEKIDYGKGPYFANKGNLTTAGYVEFQTKERIKESQISVNAGMFNTFRTMALVNLLGQQEKQSAYIASEYLYSDGPFISPQKFNRVNVMGKYALELPNQHKINFSVSHFSSKWNASGQVPQRAIDEGLITRFGAIDDKEGGNTSRTNVNFQHTKKVGESLLIKNTAYYSHYNFELYSNFTFFLNDSINGDQIKQKESRDIWGMQSEIHKYYTLPSGNISWQSGVGFRYDAVNELELSHTLNRTTILERLKFGNVKETNVFGFTGIEYHRGNWLFNPALRLDYFNFNYLDKLNNNQVQSVAKVIASPKLNIIYNPDHNIQLFFKAGKGFHSNDTRVSSLASNSKQVLPAAYGTDLGIIWKPQSRLILNMALWYLHLDQEFVYVGDEAVIEASGKSVRKGLDLGIRYQINNWLFFNADMTNTLARSIDEPEGANYIPLAPDFTLTGGLSVTHPSGFSGGLRVRHLGNRAANEDYSIVAKGYTVTDANVNYKFKKVNFGLVAENLFNVEWNETQFATESRLQNEVNPVEEIHFTPGFPFFLKATVGISF